MLKIYLIKTTNNSIQRKSLFDRNFLKLQLEVILLRLPFGEKKLMLTPFDNIRFSKRK
jgi:hypothetical protein